MEAPHHLIGDYQPFTGPIAQIFDLCSGSIGASLYINDGQGRAFSVANVITEEKNPSVPDLVHLRKLAPDESAAVHSLFDRKPYDGQSYMMPEHDCFHMVAPDGMSVLQIVYPHGQQTTTPVNDPAIQAMARELFDKAGALTRLFGSEVDRVFDARNSYEPNSILMYVDVTGFSKMSRILGQKISHTAMAALHEDCIEPFTREFGAEIFRSPEGDGIWVGFPREHNESIADTLNNKAVPMSAKIIKAYEDMMGKKELSGYPLKVALVASELEQAVQGSLFHSHIVHRGYGFITATELAERASLHQHSTNMSSVVVLDDMTASFIDRSRFNYNPSSHLLKSTI